MGQESSKDSGKPPPPPSGAVPPKKDQEKDKKGGPELDNVPTETLLAEVHRRVNCLSKPDKRIILVGAGQSLSKERCLFAFQIRAGDQRALPAMVEGAPQRAPCAAAARGYAHNGSAHCYYQAV